MEKKIISKIIFTLFALCISNIGFSQFYTETFETGNTAGNKTFSSNGTDFTLNKMLEIEEFAGIGVDGSNFYLDNFHDINNVNVGDTIGHLTASDNSSFFVNDFWIYVSNTTSAAPRSDSVRVVVKKDNNIISDSIHFVETGIQPHNNGFKNFSFVDLDIVCSEIDEVLFIARGGTIYLAIDNFSWSSSLITPAITSVTIDGGVNNQCPGTATINLTAAATHNDFDTLKWYGNSEGTGTPLGTGLTLTNQIPDSTTTYYAKINGLCGTNVSDQVTYTAKDTAAVTSITSNKNNICSVDSVELTATVDLGDNGTFEWFDQPNGQGNSLGTDLTITQTPGSTKKYYAYITSTCNNAQDSIEITVDPTKIVSTLTDITSDDNDICDGTQVTITANGVTLGTGATSNWYPQPNGQGDAISSNTSIDTVPLVTNKYYYYITGECNTVQDSIEVTVLNTDTTVTNDGSTLTSAATGVDYNWLNCADNSSTGVTTQSFTPSETGNYKVEITNSTCMNTSSCQNITITSLNGQLSQLGVALFPNPTQNIINISLVGNFTATVMNANGMQVIAPTSSSQINLSDLSSGIYFIEISKNDISETFKVIKE